MEYSAYEGLWLFFVYAFLGWCVEVSFAAIKHRRFVNRGFLSGPVCPIYGVGMVTVLWCLAPLRGNVVLLFVGAVILTTLLELFTGFVLDKFFGDKWWDYSGQPFNFHGYICLLFSLLWGVLCVFLVLVVQPFVMRLADRVPSRIGTVVLVLSLVLFVTDIAKTVANLAHIKRQLRFIEELQKNYAQHRQRAASEMMRLKMKSSDILQKHRRGTRRLLRAFPAFRQGRHKELFDQLKDLLDRRDV